ncbi:hypothetical protein [Shimia sp.]|uniref:hypothetical protein n=1 Tax=Shimia sp. TaxID=1954381 RepID=UPI003BA867EA
MRKARCVKCNKTFFSDGSSDTCQNCSKKQPNKKKQIAQEQKAKKAANSAVPKSGSQTLDIKKLADAGDKTSVSVDPNPTAPVTKDTDASSD